MDIGIPMSLSNGTTTLNFNSEFEPVEDDGFVNFIVQKVTGMDGAGIRNPITNRPHKSGAIIHAFKRTARIFTIEGELTYDNVACRWSASDLVRGLTDSILESDGTFTISPPGSLSDRYITCRLYDEEGLSDMNYGPSGPKAFTLTFIAGDWRWYTDRTPVTIADGASALIPNDGNTEAWLDFVIHSVGAVDGQGVTAFDLANYGPSDTDFDGLHVSWDGTDLSPNYLTEHTTGPVSDRTGDLNMLDETFYQFDQHNLLGGVNFQDSDFFSIAPGGEYVNYIPILGGGSTTVTVTPRDAWV